jgi:hypothetical protein
LASARLNALALSIATRFSRISYTSGWLDLHFETPQNALFGR